MYKCRKFTQAPAAFAPYYYYYYYYCACVCACACDCDCDDCDCDCHHDYDLCLSFRTYCVHSNTTKACTCL